MRASDRWVVRRDARGAGGNNTNDVRAPRVPWAGPDPGVREINRPGRKENRQNRWESDTTRLGQAWRREMTALWNDAPFRQGSRYRWYMESPSGRTVTKLIKVTRRKSILNVIFAARNIKREPRGSVREGYFKQRWRENATDLQSQYDALKIMQIWNIFVRKRRSQMFIDAVRGGRERQL